MASRDQGKTILTSGAAAAASATDQADTLEARLADLQRQDTDQRKLHGKVMERWKSLATERIRGDAAAVGESGKLADQGAILKARIEDLGHAIETTRQAITDRDQARQRNRAELRASSTAALSQQFAEDCAREVERSARMFFASIQKMHATGLEIAARLGTNEAKRLFNHAVLRPWLRNFCADVFTVDRSQQPGSTNNYLGVASEFIGARARMSLIDLAREAVGGCVRIYVDQATAEQARVALEQKGERTIAVAVPKGGYELIPIERVFADRKEAERAAAAGEYNNKRYTIHAHGEGFVLLEGAA